MTRRDLLVIVLAAANGRPYTPAQLQKAVFLITRNAPGIVTEGEQFSFVPYDYGPFDASVYREAEALRNNGEAIVTLSTSGRWKTYAASQSGIQRGTELIGGLPQPTREYIQTVSQWVLSQSFTSLVRSIYEAYPEMKANSIFQG